MSPLIAPGEQEGRLCQLDRPSLLLVQQLKDFPVSDHDDGPDALEAALRLAVELWNGHQARPQPTRRRSGVIRMMNRKAQNGATGLWVSRVLLAASTSVLWSYARFCPPSPMFQGILLALTFLGGSIPLPQWGGSLP